MPGEDEKVKESKSKWLGNTHLENRGQELRTAGEKAERHSGFVSPSTIETGVISAPKKVGR